MVLERPLWVLTVHLRSKRFLLRKQEVRDRKESPHLMSDAKSTHQAREFAVQSRKWLLKQARSVCRDEIDAQDLVQATLLRFIEQGEKQALPNQQGWEGWLARTLSNLFIDLCRRRKVQARGAADPNLRPDPILQVSPMRSAYELISDELFSQALQTLSPTLRTTLMMFLAGKGMSEIAHELGIPVGTVRKRLYDARANLREFFQRNLPSGVH
jgi:RNA polymerase sigma-70 factor (ECF subfamily)